jgi:hypothetical protein
LSITEIRTSKQEKNLNYARTQDLVEQLHIFEKQMDWSIFEILEVLKKRKADCLSIVKEKPFHYFYARLCDKTMVIRLQTSEQETEFRIPIEQLV